MDQLSVARVLTAEEVLRSVNMVRVSFALNRRKALLIPDWVEERPHYEKSNGGPRPSGKMLSRLSWRVPVDISLFMTSLLVQGFALNRVYKKVASEGRPAQLMLIYDNGNIQYTDEQMEENRRVQLTDEQRLELFGCLLGSTNASIGACWGDIKIFLNPPIARVPAHVYVSCAGPKSDDGRGLMLDVQKSGDFVLR